MSNPGNLPNPFLNKPSTSNTGFNFAANLQSADNTKINPQPLILPLNLDNIPSASAVNTLTTNIFVAGPKQQTHNSTINVQPKTSLFNNFSENLIIPPAIITEIQPIKRNQSDAEFFSEKQQSDQLNKKDKLDHRIKIEFEPQALQQKVERQKFKEQNKKIGSFDQLQKQKNQIVKGQTKLQTNIKQLAQRINKCDKNQRAMKDKIKKNEIRIQFLKENKDEHAQNVKKEIRQLAIEIDNKKTELTKNYKESQDARTSLKACEQDLEKNYYKKILVVQDELKIAEKYQNLVNQKQRIRRNIIQNQNQYNLKVTQLISKNEQFQRKRDGQKSKNSVLTHYDSFILELCKKQQILNEQNERLRQKIKKENYQDKIFIDQKQNLFERALFDNVKEFLQYMIQKDKLAQQEEQLTVQERNQMKARILLASVSDLKELLLQRFQIQKLSKQRQIQQKQREKQQREKKIEDQRLQQERIAQQKIAREQEQKRRQEQKKAKQQQFKQLQNEIEQYLNNWSFKIQIQKHVISNIQDFEYALNISNKKSELIEQASKNHAILKEKISTLRSVGQKIGLKKAILDDYQKKLQDLKQEILYETKKKQSEQQQILNLVKQNDRKRRYQQEKEEIRQRQRKRFISQLPQKELYADKIKQFKDRMKPQTYLILQKKQKYINQIKVLIQLNKISKEQIEANKFDINRYQFLIYKKGKLIDQILKQESEGKEPIITQEFSHIQAQLQKMEGIINMNMINNSYDIPDKLLLKTKQDLFEQVSYLEIKQKKQDTAKLQQQINKLLLQKQKKQKTVLLLRQELQKAKNQHNIIAKQKLDQFKRNIYACNIQEEDRIITKEVAQKPFNIKIENKEIIQEYFELKQPQELTMINNELRELRSKRKDLQLTYKEHLQKSKKPLVSKNNKPPVFLGQIDQQNPRIKKLNEELKQLIKKCEQINKNKKIKQKGEVSKSRIQNISMRQS